MAIYDLKNLFIIIIGATILLKSTVICSDSGEERPSLFKKHSEVLELWEDSLTSVINNESKSLIILFYSHWCGHCVEFAPTWVKLTERLAAWQNVLQLAVFNCATDKTNPLCQHYQIPGTPTMKIFPPGSTNNTLGRELANFNVLEEIELEFAGALYNYSISQQPPVYNFLSPVKAHIVDTVRRDIPETALNAVLLILPKDNVQLAVSNILHWYGIKSVWLRWTGEDTSFAHGNSLLVLRRHGKDIQRTHRLEEDHLKDYFYIQEQLESELTDGNKTTTTTERTTSKSHVTEENFGARVEAARVHTQDLVSALHYSLRKEIAQQGVLKPPQLRALQEYLRAARDFLPVPDEVRSFLTHALAKVASRDHMTSDQWLNLLEADSSSSSYLPHTSRWVRCAGSSSLLRGYPCSLWTSFHTLLATAHNKRSNALPVLRAVAGYVREFFSCTECSRNFGKMAVEISKIRSSEEAVLWLWRAHNRANERLKGKGSEDPKYHKTQFPSTQQCPDCRSSNSQQWNESNVLQYLLKIYDESEAVRDLEMSQPSGLSQSLVAWPAILGISTLDVLICVTLYSGCAMVLAAGCLYLVRVRRFKRRRFY